METGTIKTLAEKGFGFITPDNGGSDLFFHMSALTGVSFDDLKQGDKVSFTSTEGPKGMNAVDVALADDAGTASDEGEMPAEETAEEVEM